MDGYVFGQDMVWVKAILAKLVKNQRKIMATIQQLTAQVAALQTAVDTEQQEIRDAMDALGEQITALQALVVDGGTEAERQAVADALQTIQDDVVATVDRPVTVPPVGDGGSA